MDAAIVAEALHSLSKFIRRCICAQRHDADVDAGPLPGSREVAHVRSAGLILADKHYDQARMNSALPQRNTLGGQVRAQLCCNCAAVYNLSRHGTRFRALEEATLEHVRREVRLGRNFNYVEFERAFSKFRSLYQIRPSKVSCSPDVLLRYCALFERSAESAHSREIRYEGIPISAAVLPPGIIAFEGEVDEERMGDW